MLLLVEAIFGDNLTNATTKKWREAFFVTNCYITDAAIDGFAARRALKYQRFERELEVACGAYFASGRRCAFECFAIPLSGGAEI